MAGRWNSPLAALPTDGQQVWLRSSYFTEPVAYFFRADTLDFSSTGGDITVSGAGQADVNGQYYRYPVPQPNAGYYLKTANYYIYLDAGNANWTLSPAIFAPGNDQTYQTDSPKSVLGPWSPGLGAAPAPTITASIIIPCYLVDRWAPYP